MSKHLHQQQHQQLLTQSKIQTIKKNLPWFNLPQYRNLIRSSGFLFTRSFGFDLFSHPVWVKMSLPRQQNLACSTTASIDFAIIRLFKRTPLPLTKCVHCTEMIYKDCNVLILKQKPSDSTKKLQKGVSGKSLIRHSPLVMAQTILLLNIWRKQVFLQRNQ